MTGGHRYRFRVRAIDRAGNPSPWVAATLRPSLVQEHAHNVGYAERWERRTLTNASGRRVASSRQRGATAALRTRAKTVEVLAATGPWRGRAAVVVNGTRVRTVDLYSARPRRRQTVATLNRLASGRESAVQVRVLDRKRPASGGAGVALDAFLVIRRRGGRRGTGSGAPPFR